MLKDDAPTNMVTLRGFARYPKIDTMQEVYGLKPAAIAVYPMYKGLARLVGMDVARRRRHAGRAGGDAEEGSGASTTSSSCTTSTPTAPARTATSPAKVEMIEKLDAVIPRIRALKPDVLIVTGDHSTPSKMQSHSWHPVPTLLWRRRAARTR